MLILSLILAHLLADFYLQTDEMVKEKLVNIKKHIAHHLLMNGIVLTGFWMIHFENALRNLFFPLVFIIVTHLLIDLLKIKLLDSIKIKNEANIKRLGFFVVDQLLHLGMIILSCQLFFGKNSLGIFEVLLQDHQLNPVNKGLFIIIIIMLATNVSGHMIKILIGSLPHQLLTFEGKYAFKNERQINQSAVKNALTEEYNFTVFSKHELSRGKLIGYIERLLVLLLTFYSSYPAIGFIVAAKSIARFKQMEDRDWAEYFLLGTLTSMFLGITFGIVLREVLT